MKNRSKNRTVIDQMNEAFLGKNLAAAVATVSDDSVWIHHGSQKLPSLRFEGKRGVEKFFHTSFTEMDFEYYRPTRFLEVEDTITVFGEESFVYRGEKLNNKWVQIYTLADGRITRMEEFATSTRASDYMVVS